MDYSEKKTSKLKIIKKKSPHKIPIRPFLLPFSAFPQMRL
jgi:hypothetical protein